MLDLTNVKAPIEMANGLPNGCYVDADLYQHEQNTLFRNNWAAIGFGKDLPKPGCVKPIEFAGLPLLLVRNHDNEIKVFENVCRHRGMILVSEAQHLRGPITCPYHAWAYDLNGQLRKTPQTTPPRPRRGPPPPTTLQRDGGEGDSGAGPYGSLGSSRHGTRPRAHGCSCAPGL